MFGRDTLPRLDEADARKYELAYICAKRNRALAYYFYIQGSKLTVKTRQQIEGAFRKFLGHMKTVTIEHITMYIELLQRDSNYSPLYINRMLKNIKYVVEFCYKFDEDFPKLPPVSESATPDVVIITEHDILKAHRALMRLEDYESALMLQMMYVLHVMPFELRLIRFDDVTTTRDGKHMIKLRVSRNSKIKNVMLSANIYNKIIDYKNYIKDDKKKYYVGQRSLGDRRTLRGYFIFNVRTETITERLKSGFNSKLPWFSCSSQDVVKALNIT